MKVIVEYNLPDEQEEYNMAAKGPSLHSAVWDFDQWLRGECKHGEYTDAEFEILEKCRERLWGHLEENDVSLH